MYLNISADNATNTVYDWTIERTMHTAISFLHDIQQDCATEQIESTIPIIENSVSELCMSLMKDEPIVNKTRCIRIGKDCVVEWRSDGVMVMASLDVYNPIAIIAAPFDEDIEQNNGSSKDQLIAEWSENNANTLCNDIMYKIQGFIPAQNEIAIAAYIRYRFSQDSSQKPSSVYNITRVKDKIEKMNSIMDTFDQHYERFDAFMAQIKDVFANNLDKVRACAREYAVRDTNIDEDDIGQPHSNGDKIEFYEGSFNAIIDSYAPFNIKLFVPVLSQYPDVLSYKLSTRYTHLYYDMKTKSPAAELYDQFKKLVKSYMSVIHRFAYPASMKQKMNGWYSDSWATVLYYPLKNDMTNILFSKEKDVAVIIPSKETMKEIEELIPSYQDAALCEKFNQISDTIISQSTVPFASPSEIYENAAAYDHKDEKQYDTLTCFNRKDIQGIYASTIFFCEDDFASSLNTILADMVEKELTTLWYTGKSASDDTLLRILHDSFNAEGRFDSLYRPDSEDVVTLKNAIRKNIPVMLNNIENMQNALLTCEDEQFLDWLLMQKSISKAQYKTRIAELTEKKRKEETQ